MKLYKYSGTIEELAVERGRIWVAISLMGVITSVMG